MEQRLEKKDLRFIAVCLLVIAASLGVGVPLFYQVFPEASIGFEITRDQAQDLARSFLEERGFDLEGYRHSAIFQYDDRAKTFLERELGLEKANELIGRTVRLWRWSNRWVRELQKEEFRVELTPSGDLAGFSHLVEEEREGARLDRERARRMAERFVEEVLGRDLDSLEFVEGRAIDRPARTDYLFTWELKGFEVAEATYRIEVGVQGDQIGSFREYLKIPEAWQRQYDELRSRNQVTGMVAGFFLFLFLLAMLFVFFVGARRREVRWKTAAVFGIIAFVLTFLARLNELPVSQYGYDTTEAYGSFLIQRLLYGLLTALGQGIFVFFLTGAAEPVYRRSFGGQIRLSEQFLPRGMRTKRFFLGSLLGFALTAFFFAYQILFYLGAERFGAWSPARVPYDEMVNTYFPWITVLLIGFLPAVSEEFIFRAFSIPFLQKYLKSRWAALILPAFVWGFAHAAYPQQPFFIRGLEVGLAGIAVGAVFLRWGILPVLVWHYTVDALYTALILLRSSNPYFVASAALSAGLMLLPLLAALLLYLRRGFFVDPSTLLNQEEATPLPLPSRPREYERTPEVQLLSEFSGSVLAPYTPLSWRRIGAAVLVVTAASLSFLLKGERLFGFVDYALTRQEALQEASERMRALGVDPDTFEVAVSQYDLTDREAVEYALERGRREWIERIYQRDLRASLWGVRFFRPGQKEEFRIGVDPKEGTIYAVRHLLPEEAAGADIEEEEARAIAEEEMRRYGLDPADFELEESSSEKLEARRDHRFVWEAREGDPRNLEGMKYRVEVKIAGDQPVSLRRHFKLPEAWLRHREEVRTFRTLLDALRISLVVAFSLHLLWLLIRQVRSGKISWKPPLALGGMAGGLFLVDFLNRLPAIEYQYVTWHTPSVFALMQAVGALIVSIAIALLTAGIAALASGFYPDWPARLRSSVRYPALRDGLASTLLVLAAGASFDQMRTWLYARFPSHLPVPGFALPSGLDMWCPALKGGIGGLYGALFFPAAAGIALYYARRYLKGSFRTGVAILGLSLLWAGASARDPGEFGGFLFLFLAHLLFVLCVARFLLRNNLLAYVLTGFLVPVAEYARVLLSLSARTYQLHGYVLLLYAALLVLAFLTFLRKTEKSASS